MWKTCPALHVPCQVDVDELNTCVSCGATALCLWRHQLELFRIACTLPSGLIISLSCEETVLPASANTHLTDLFRITCTLPSGCITCASSDGTSLCLLHHLDYLTSMIRIAVRLLVKLTLTRETRQDIACTLPNGLITCLFCER